MRKRYIRSPAVVRRHVAGETLLVPIRTGPAEPADGGHTMFIVLNETAEALWELLAEAHSADELAQHLIVQYEVTPSQARADVEAFLSELRAARLVDVEEE
ncbi:MAG TPA: PqqD family protein [Gemmatimonadaceae bacterium]|nr:PqqD family protein [Gemmatimonadaceae bacterium]